jgi:hypothetical protein
VLLSSRQRNLRNSIDKRAFRLCIRFPIQPMLLRQVPFQRLVLAGYVRMGT